MHFRLKVPTEGFVKNYSVYLSKFEVVESEFKAFNRDVENLTAQFFLLCPSEFLIENSMKICGYQYSKSYRIKSYQLLWPKTGKLLSLKEALDSKCIDANFYEDQMKKVHIYTLIFY